MAPFRHRRDRPALTALAADLARWLGAHLAELEKAEPVMPLEDRAADTWEPLIAVADLAAGEWPALARHAAVVLTADRDQAADMSDRIRLLADCRDRVRGRRRAAHHHPHHPAPRPTPKRPGASHGPGGITPMRLGAMLREYDIRSANIRFGEPIGQVKGYYRADFTDAWARYCPAPAGEPSQPSQPSPPSSGPGRLKTWDGSSRPTAKRTSPHGPDLRKR